MTSEEFSWWSVMIDLEHIGPRQQARLLSHIAAGVRNNGHLKGPDGEKSVWSIDHFIDPERWAPPAPPAASKGPSLDAIKSFFKRFGF